MDELAKRILHRRQLEEQGDKPAVPYNPCVGMSPEEMSRYIQFLFEQIQQKDAQHKELLEQLAGIKEELKRANETISSNTSEQQRLSTLVSY